MFQIYGRSKHDRTPLPEGTISFITGMTEALTNAEPDSDFGAYLNYVDPSLSAREAHNLYYGDELYEKLLRIKERVDPKRVFWNPQAVGAW